MEVTNDLLTGMILQARAQKNIIPSVAVAKGLFSSMPLQSEFSGVTAALRLMSYGRIKQVADLHSSHHGYIFVKSWTSILYQSRWWFRLCVGNVYLKQFMSFMIQCDLRSIFETGRSTTKCWEASTIASSMKSFNSRCWNWGMNLTWSWRGKFDKLKKLDDSFRWLSPVVWRASLWVWLL